MDLVENQDTLLLLIRSSYMIHLELIENDVFARERTPCRQLVEVQVVLLIETLIPYPLFCEGRFSHLPGTHNETHVIREQG